MGAAQQRDPDSVPSFRRSPESGIRLRVQLAPAQPALAELPPVELPDEEPLALEDAVPFEGNAAIAMIFVITLGLSAALFAFAFAL